MGFSFISKRRRNLIPEGEYEVYLKDCGEAESRDGKSFGLKFEFFIREDIEQPCKGRSKAKTFWYGQDTGGLSEKDVEKVADWGAVLGVPEGQESDTDDLIGQSCVMGIKHFINDAGEAVDYICYLKKSEEKPFLSTLPQPHGFQEINEDEDGDLPF